VPHGAAAPRGNARTRRGDPNGDRCDNQQHDPDASDKVRIKEVGFEADSGSLSIVWLGAPRAEMFVLARGAAEGEPNLYYSSNYGKE